MVEFVTWRMNGHGNPQCGNQKPDVGHQKGKKIESQEMKGVSNNVRNAPMDYSDSETCKVGGYVSDTSSETLNRWGVNDGEKMKKKRKVKYVRNSPSHVLSAGNSKIVEMEQYPRQMNLNGNGDGHMDNLLHNDQILSIDAGDASKRSPLNSKIQMKTRIAEKDQVIDECTDTDAKGNERACKFPMQEPFESGPRNGEKLEIQETERVYDYVRNVPMDCSGDETWKDGGYVSETSSETLDQMEVKDGGKLDVTEHSIVDLLNQASNAGNSDIGEIKQYPRILSTSAGDALRRSTIVSEKQIKKKSISKRLKKQFLNVHPNMLDNFTNASGDSGNELKKVKRNFLNSVDDGHASMLKELAKRAVLSLTKPSYVLGLGSKNIQAENRGRLWSLLGKLVRQHNWLEASGVLSMVLKGTCKDRSSANNRMKYWVTLEHLRRMGGIKLVDIRHIYGIWLGKIGSLKSWPLKAFEIERERLVVLHEYILFCLMQGKLGNAQEAATSLMEECEFENDPTSNMVVGLTYCQLWYSTIPKEMQLVNTDKSCNPMQSNMSGTRFDNPVENSEGSSTSNIPKANASFLCNLETSSTSGTDISMENEVNSFREGSVEVEPQDFYSNSDDMSGDEESSTSNYGDDMQHATIFTAHGGLDSCLFPFRMPRTTEDLVEFIYLHRKVLNDHYENALKYLRSALHSTLPLLAALLPLIQLLLIGDKVKEAMQELDMFCHNSSTALPFRLRASLLECFDRNNYAVLSCCYENILKKDPTCSYSVSRLVSMHQNGKYCSKSLLEMIALHLEATYGEESIWRVFALCFSELCQTSICLNGSETGIKKTCSSQNDRMAKICKEGSSANAWTNRLTWWLTRHFHMHRLLFEIAAGDLPLLTYKAACASYMYGQDFEYVGRAYACLENERKMDLLSFLQAHMP